MPWPRVRGMRAFEFATPGPFRLELNDLVLSGKKTSTTGLLDVDYEQEQESVEHIGERLALVDNDDRYVATLEIVSVQVCRFDKVTLAHALAEGEGWESIEDWRGDHRKYWAEHGHDIGDDTRVVCLSFRVVDSSGR